MFQGELSETKHNMKTHYHLQVNLIKGKVHVSPDEMITIIVPNF